MERDFPTADLEAIRESNVLILAPSHYPLVAAIDIRPSPYSSPTLTTLNLEQTLAPCPQLPDIKIDVDTNIVKSLKQVYEIVSEDLHQYITAVASQNILNRLSQTRDDLADTDDSDKTYIVLIDYFTTLKKTMVWRELKNHLLRTHPSPIAKITSEFVKDQARWEQDSKNYITGANGARTLWQKD